MRAFLTGLCVGLCGQVALSAAAAAEDADKPMVTVSGGQLMGRYRRTISDTTYASYEGVPFGAPPVGDLRFAPPKPADPWTGVLDVSQGSHIRCAQAGAYDRTEEDCLYLNVFAPVNRTQETGPMAVMMWICGGGLTSCDPNFQSWGPGLWMDQEVVVVSPNYRLGNLGFMGAGTADAPGNQGFLDLVLALEWINENVEQFGGDPSRVTIFGVSSGSWAVSYLTMTPLANGLFHRAIQQSGAVFTPYWLWHTTEDSVYLADRLSKGLNCSVGIAEDPEAGLACLRATNLDAILATQEWGSPDTFNIQKLFRPHATIDGVFLPDNPVKLMERGEYNHVDLMQGVTRDEGLLQVYVLETNPGLYSLFQLLYDNLCPMLLFGRVEKGDVTEQDKDLCDKFTEYYLGSKANFTSQHYEAISDMITDASFWYGAHKQAQWAVQQGDNVYQYIFSFKGRFGFADNFGLDNSKYGIAHADDVYFYWNPLGGTIIPLDEREAVLSRRMVTSWANFAKTGKPTAPGVHWEPVLADKHQYLNVDEECTMEMEPDYVERMGLWDQWFKYPEGNTLNPQTKEHYPKLAKTSNKISEAFKFPF